MNKRATKPSVRTQKIKAISYDSALAVSMLGMGVAQTALPSDYSAAGLLSCSAVAAATIAAKHYYSVNSEPQPVDVVSLDCALSVLHSMVLQSKKVTTEPKLRICVYIRDHKDHSFLKRVTSLVGDTEVDDEPREISVKSGVAGKVAITGKIQLTTLERDGNLIEFLKEFGFEPHEAVLIREDRRSWFGIPLGVAGSSCIGVLFCDSCDPNFFEEPAQSRQKMLRQGAIPIATLLKTAYNNMIK